jgi:ABC-type sugar transport system ATPase subunit
MATVELEHVTVRSGGATLLDDVSLLVADGELLGLVGASGSGKTSLLRVIAGLADLSAGTVRLAGADVAGMPPSARGISMVFQHAALIPHRDVRGNVAFPLELRHDEDAEIRTRVTAETRALHIEALLGRSPRELSAGEAQLVQVARALVRGPSLLLLDEPLAGLDAMLVAQVRLELRALQQGYAVTTLLATNDPLEAMTMPDRLVVLHGGRIVQEGTPIDVYDRPATLVAAAATGTVSALTAAVQTADDGGWWLVHPAFRLRSACRALADHVGGTAVVALRPNWLRPAADGPVAATVTEAGLVTGTVTVALAPTSGGGDTGPADELVVAAAGRSLRRGEQLALHIDEFALFDVRTGAAIEDR